MTQPQTHESPLAGGLVQSDEAGGFEANATAAVEGRQVDLAQAARFLTLLDEEAEVFTFQTFTDAKPSPRPDPLAKVRHGSLADLAPWLCHMNASGAGVFVTVNETDGKGRRRPNIVRVRAVWQEDDGEGKPLPLEPHIVVQSSPGKHHRYLLVDGLPLEEAAPVLQCLVDDYGSDPKAATLERVLRVPGFYHRKGEPHMVQLVQGDALKPYTAGEVRRAFPATPKPPAAPTPDTDGKLSDGRRDDLYKAGCDYRDGGARGAKLLRLLRGYNLANFDPPKPDDEVAETARNVERYARTPAAVAPTIANAADLLRREFAPVQWAVQGILPEGISILSGDPKIGKSWLLYQACVAVAGGKPLWAGRDPEHAGDALMLALEDNDRRLQRRLQTLLPRFTTITGRKLMQPDVSRLHYATEWPRAEDGVAKLREWLVAHPGARLVVVDTVSAFRAKDVARNKSAYAADYEVGEAFKPLAREFKCAIVLVMHNRKQHSADALQLVSGTQGITGGVDNVLVLRRERGQLDAGLYVDGRDIEEPQEIAMRFDGGYWSSNGESVDEARMSKERRDVLRIVAGLGTEAKVRGIADAMPERKYSSVRSLLAKMVADGHLVLIDGVYRVPVPEAKAA